MLQVVGEERGEEEIEYCRIRMGGSMVRKSPRGNAAEEYSSRRSNGERRFRAISASKSTPASARIFALIFSSGVLSAMRVMFYFC